MSVDLLIGVACYLALWLIAGYFLWRAYRVGIKNDLRLIKNWGGKHLPHRRRIARSYAMTELLTGVALVTLSIAIPLLALPMKIWPSIILIIGSSRQLQLMKYSRGDTDT